MWHVRERSRCVGNERETRTRGRARQPMRSSRPAIWSALLAALTSPSSALVLPTRRAVIERLVLSAPAALALSHTEAAVAAPDLRKYSALAPLGDVTAVGKKRTGLTQDELAVTLKRDLTVGATGKGGYFVSGDLSQEIFRDDARFIDPTNVAEGLSRYIKALSLLFDPTCSSVELLAGPKPDAATRTIYAELRSSGTLKLPWRPKVRPWISYMTWTIDADGLIAEQSQTWDITPAEALGQTFNPFQKAANDCTG
eukprot:scaffold124763_cov66-Phaeocystis_antarctica.AAC.3